MSAQGTTLGRGNAMVPMWPLAVLIAGAAVIVLAISLFDARPATQAPARPVVSTGTLVERSANSGVIPAASTNEVTRFGPRTLVERFANSGAIPAASTHEAAPPVTLVERFANSGAIPAASMDEAIRSGRMSLVEHLANSGAIPSASTP